MAVDHAGHEAGVAQALVRADAEFARGLDGDLCGLVAIVLVLESQMLMISVAISSIVRFQSSRSLHCSASFFVLNSALTDALW